MTLPNFHILAQTAETPKQERMPAVSGNSNGPSVDRAGTPVVDPTKNVLDLVQALEKRLDAIGALNEKIREERMKHVDDKIVLQAKITDMHAMYNADITKLRSEYQKELDQKESDRVNSIRVVDQAAVRNESERSQQAVNTLATAQAATAETLRSAVNTTATNIATQLDRTTSAITERIASLEKAQYTGAGRATVADPNAERLAIAVNKLVEAQSTNVGKTEGVGMSWQVILGVASLVGVVFVLMTRRQTH